MTRKEKIIEILGRYEKMAFSRPSECAEEILALPLDVPTADEIEKWAEYCASNSVTDHNKRVVIKAALTLGAKWAIEEIKKRNTNN